MKERGRMKMIITLNITVGKDYWGDDVVRDQIELKSETDRLADLPWEAICAGVVQSAIKEYEEKQKGAESK